jgi:hypothetical protein
MKKLQLVLIFTITPIFVFFFPIISSYIIGKYSLSSFESSNVKSWLESWGSYAGGIIGALATIVAIMLTLSYYRKKDDKTQTGFNNYFIIDKINAILNCIAERKTINNGLYSYFEELKFLEKNLDEYNSSQSQLLSYFTGEGIKTLWLAYDFGLDKNNNEIYSSEEKKYINSPKDIIEKSKIIGHSSLYSNASELIKGHPELSGLIDMQKGGSASFWVAFIYVEQYASAPEFIKMREEFFMLITSLTNELVELQRHLHGI